MAEHVIQLQIDVIVLEIFQEMIVLNVNHLLMEKNVIRQYVIKIQIVHLDKDVFLVDV